jgi:3-hydroxyacyl-[acyl-carrier-protein] dehydratase
VRFTLNEVEIREIFNLLPHRYPFLLIDRVLEVSSLDYIKAIKNVTINEPFFQGHFPDEPVMPGVLIVEAIAQAGGILYSKSHEPKSGIKNMFYLAGLNNVKFKQMVVPGDQLNIHVKIIGHKGAFWRMDGEAFVDNKLVCSVEILCAVKEVES